MSAVSKIENFYNISFKSLATCWNVKYNRRSLRRVLLGQVKLRHQPS